MARLPNLPKLLKTKIYKTGQTRGADDDEVFQNRVARYSTVLIPLGQWEGCTIPDDGSAAYENGYIVLVEPAWYFGTVNPDNELAQRGLTLGQNALVFYETRDQWEANDPTLRGWEVATRRRPPLGGSYIARISGTTAEGREKVLAGFTTTSSKGAGIRVYEYASTANVNACRTQLEALFWLCKNAIDTAVASGMTARDAKLRRDAVLDAARIGKLLDLARLADLRVVDAQGVTTCPLCLEEMSATALLTRITQAAGRATLDQAVTEASLFHLQELRVGKSNHKPHNLGWGHHHCNVVVKDSGITETLEWMHKVLRRNKIVD